MRIGITYDLKTARPADALAPPARPDNARPDDDQEEFDSPATIEAIASVFRRLGHDVDLLGDGRELIERLLDRPPDLVFNFAEGQGVGRSREARVPALLEMLGIPYTGSDPLTMAVTLDKDCAKRLAASAGIAVPRALVIPVSRDAKSSERSANQKSHSFPGTAWERAAREALPRERQQTGGGASKAVRSQAEPGNEVGFSNLPSAICHLPFPVIVKPAWEGSSKGIRTKCLVKSPEDLPDVVEWLQREQRQPIIVEEYIEGDEVTVGVLGNDPPEVFGVMRVSPVQPAEHFIYSLEIKRDYRRLVRYECPAPLPAETTCRIEEAALKAYDVLGCRDVSRIDFRLRDGIPYFLEVNPLPGLNPEDSDLVIMARLLGWSHARLVQTILDAALQRLDMQREHPEAFATRTSIEN
jgi:D-alanine-D-alanine ligase